MTLVGINTAILSRGGGSVGIGLSIPVDMANTLMTQLLEFGDVKRGLLGVAMQDLTPQLAEAFNLQGKKGAVVSEVIKGSAAEDIGMKSGDVITGFNQYQVDNSADLRNAVGLLRAGETGTVQYYRDGELISKDVRIKGAEEITQARTKELLNARLTGATFENVQSNASSRRGVQVGEIKAGSPAARTGLEVGDVIVSVNKTRVTTVDELAEVTADQSGVLLIRLVRDKRALVLVVQ